LYSCAWPVGRPFTLYPHPDLNSGTEAVQNSHKPINGEPNPKFTELGERLEKIKERHEQGFLTSLEFLKEMLVLAKEVVEAERGADPVVERDRAKEALTEIFNEAKNSNTHVIVERTFADIDEIVKKVRLPEWQQTTQGERLVQELRRTLLEYKLHTFDKACGYIRQYY
jgi:type I restriction enzyme, R subunit